MADNAIVILPVSELQQKYKITGTVTDEATGVTLPGVSVVVQGTTKGTTTGADGKFTHNLPNANAVLVFSFVGYQTETIAISGKSIIDVKLKTDVKNLDEVVVVGYGTHKKIDLTGAVQVIEAKELESRPAPNLTALLQGNANGIIFTPPSNGFSPGAAQTMEIRGSAALNSSTPPLIVIDGVPTDMADFNTINPDDVESITVLKDAAASSIYGARAPYGVLVVTLKKGKKNQLFNCYTNKLS
jgi:TonB-dependent SusC/RagA subfamily outer membrane receptor